MQPLSRSRAILLLCLLMSLSSACSSLVHPAPPTPTPTVLPTATPEPTPTPVPPTPAPTPTPFLELEAKMGIQKTANLYARAFNDNDPEALQEAVDQDNLPFRRCVQTRFDSYQKSALAGKVYFIYRVEQIRQRDLGFVEAHLKMNDSEYGVDWLFRQLPDGRWVMSEPSEEQLGEPKRVEADNFIFTSYAWSDDSTATIMDLVKKARQRVERRLGKVPDEKALIAIHPIYRLTGPSPNALATYGEKRPMDEADIINVYAPHSFNFGSYSSVEGWEKALEDVLVHEYTHMTHVRSFDKAGWLMSWVIEGLPEWVSEDDRAAEVTLAVRRNRFIPIIDPVDRLQKQDLMHLQSLNSDISLAYGFSYSLIRYICETYGGLDGFWKLAHAYQESQDLDKALRESFGVSYDQFDQGWRAWLKRTYK